MSLCESSFYTNRAECALFNKKMPDLLDEESISGSRGRSRL